MTIETVMIKRKIRSRGRESGKEETGRDRECDDKGKNQGGWSG